MWARLDDALIDHQKVFLAGELLGPNGPAIAIGFYAIALMWSNKQLADGHLSKAVIKSFRHVTNPLAVADALAKAGLFERNGNGYVIHDYTDFNPRAVDVKTKRRLDAKRKAKERASA